MRPTKYSDLWSCPPAIPTFSLKVNTLIRLSKYSFYILSIPSLRGIPTKTESPFSSLFSILSRKMLPSLQTTILNRCIGLLLFRAFRVIRIAYGPYHSPGFLPSFRPSSQILWIPNTAFGLSINSSICLLYVCLRRASCNNICPVLIIQPHPASDYNFDYLRGRKFFLYVIHTVS